MYVHVSLRHRRVARRASESVKLARSLDSTIVEAWHRQHVPWSATTPLCDARARKAVRGATAELSSLADALRQAEHPDSDSLQLCRDLLCDGFSSPLYAGRADDLRREAGRLRFRVLANG